MPCSLCPTKRAYSDCMCIAWCTNDHSSNSRLAHPHNGLHAVWRAQYHSELSDKFDNKTRQQSVREFSDVSTTGNPMMPDECFKCGCVATLATCSYPGRHKEIYNRAHSYEEGFLTEYRMYAEKVHAVLGWPIIQIQVLGDTDMSTGWPGTSSCAWRLQAHAPGQAFDGRWNETSKLTQIFVDPEINEPTKTNLLKFFQGIPQQANWQVFGSPVFLSIIFGTKLTIGILATCEQSCNGTVDRPTQHK